MVTIFFDTCAIRYLVKQGIGGDQVRNALSQKGGHVSYVNAHNLRSGPDSGQKGLNLQNECLLHNFKNSTLCFLSPK